MSVPLHVRALRKLAHLHFQWGWRTAFAHLGRNAHLYAPFRVDGADAISLGSGSVFQRGAWLYCRPAAAEPALPAQLTIGDRCVFGYNNHITAIRDVRIGNSVLTANNVYISDNVHGYEDINTPVIDQPVKFKGMTEIGDGCWIGENACIIGARIGRNCVIGANAVVTRDIPDYCVAVGAPARVIRRYDTATRQWRAVGPSAG